MPHDPMPEAIASVRVLHLLPHQGVGGLQRSVIDLVRHERMDGATDEIVLTERALDTDGDFMAPATPVHFLGLTGARLAARIHNLLQPVRPPAATFLIALLLLSGTVFRLTRDYRFNQAGE